MNILSPRVCLSCGKSIIGRSDKKFCDAYCRNSFNNQHKSADEHYMQAINTQIRKNRRILKTLSPEGKATIRREILERMGFDFQYFTGVYKPKSGKTVYYMSYEYGFAPIVDIRGIQKAVIIQKQDYMGDHPLQIWK